MKAVIARLLHVVAHHQMSLFHIFSMRSNKKAEDNQWQIKKEDHQLRTKIKNKRCLKN